MSAEKEYLVTHSGTLDVYLAHQSDQLESGVLKLFNYCKCDFITKTDKIETLHCDYTPAKSHNAILDSMSKTQKELEIIKLIKEST